MFDQDNELMALVWPFKVLTVVILGCIELGTVQIKILPSSQPMAMHRVSMH